MILYFLLIAISVVGIHGVDDKMISELGTKDSSISEWMRLHEEILKKTSLIQSDPLEVKEILLKMSSIEKTDVYREWYTSLKDHQIDRIDHYKTLFDKAQYLDIFKHPDASITDILLQTFEYDSNDCIPSYFESLAEIYETFKDMRNITTVLDYNRERQYENCWLRIVDQIRNTSMLFKSELLDELSKYVLAVYFDKVNIIDSFVRLASNNGSMDKNRLIDVIRMFLRNGSQESSTIRFLNLIEKPCESLILKTKDAMMQIYGLLEYSGKKNFMTEDQAYILNKCMICQQISANKQHIMSSIKQPLLSDDMIPLSNRAQSIPVDTTDRQIEKVGLFPEGQTKKVTDVLRRLTLNAPYIYETKWSDGTVSNEHDEYLYKYWPGSFSSYYVREDLRKKKERERKSRPIISKQ